MTKWLIRTMADPGDGIVRSQTFETEHDIVDWAIDEWRCMSDPGDPTVLINDETFVVGIEIVGHSLMTEG